ncbi:MULTISPECIES: eCIS core domain-containing protein [unclassified Streptomyces]|uniref:eCIS core domain-containing protein n=1 Tax=unclassified Streptomyces TaxID=2593676 RepID=UPI000DAE5FB6|nr:MULTISPECIES: DUF4157 domain-containing protein [unclassified Streptomyces]PZT71607.1 hypothetical protein DNK55_31050 [Streptomyces sp. AC1-42T]PZT73266.1 hypothetical protein DNK56_34025 [Streptomyces sp. AC1-42W]
MLQRVGHLDEKQRWQGPSPGPAGPVVQRSSVKGVLRGSGEALDGALRAEMEERLGADFSDVQLHTGHAAQRSAAEIGARAYTSGSHVVIGAGGVDKHTLAHELTHVIQQRQGPVAGRPTEDGLSVSDPGDRFEREAEANATRVMRAPAAVAEPHADAPRPSPCTGSPAVQRSMYLANYDDRIYADSNQPGSEFAFVRKDAFDRLLFVPYSGVDRIRDVVRNTGLSDFSDSQLDDLIRLDPAFQVELLKELGGFHHYVSTAGTLDPLDGNALGRGLPGLLAMVVRSGPRLWQNSGGSRVPRAEGHLLIRAGTSREQVEQRLGVDLDADYADVQVHQVPDTIYEAARRDSDGLFEYAGLGPDDPHRMLYFSTATTRRSASHRIRIANQRYSDGEFFDPSLSATTRATLDAAYQELMHAPPRQSTGWIPGTRLTPVDRGPGQDAAMKNWNALGLAAYANLALGCTYDLNQNWEWLHIQGAQIGGATDEHNLVAGTYVTNSAMMPFESLIAEWAKADAHNFQAQFLITPGNTLFPQYIELWVQARKHQHLGDLPPTLLARFEPLSGRIVDRMAGEITKRNVDTRPHLPSPLPL